MAKRKPSRPAPKNVTPVSAKPTVKRTPAASRTPGTAVAPANTPPKRALTLIGVGASAGGLEAIDAFLRSVPLGANCAIVVVQHLDPTHKDFLPELLQKVTPLKVQRIQDGTRVRPDNVYVIPPNRDVSIKAGVLKLHVTDGAQAVRLPIDFFFSSLAEAQQEQSIGVVLSGMGSDGTAGAKAIKEHGGVVLVQDPTQAKFASMPSSVINAGLADVVAPVEGLFASLEQYLQHVPLLLRPVTAYEPTEENSMEKVVQILRSHTGHDFSLYKRSTLYRRIERRMALHQLEKIERYVRFLSENPQEVDLLFRELLIGVTQFFRDPLLWETLKSQTLPGLLARDAGSPTLRAWIPGCSTGEEAYSLAMVFRETLDSLPGKSALTLKIFATDIDPDAVSKARQGLFPASITESVSAERLSRFFTKEPRGYRIAKEIREMIIFAPHNLIMSPPFTKLDLLSCRNLLIYFTAELQKKLIPLFHYCLNPGGVLVLGSAETIGSFTDLFNPLDGPARVFQRQENWLTGHRLEFPSSYVAASLIPPHLESSADVGHDNLQHQAEQWLLKNQAPAAVLVTTKGDILYISGRTSRYLEPVAGKANWNLFAMVREGLSYPLHQAFEKIAGQTHSITTRSCKVDTGDSTCFVKATLQQITTKGALSGLVMIVFSDGVDPAQPQVQRRVKNAKGSDRLRELTQELAHMQQQLQTTREDMQTSQEELKSANEELQSANEELQSTNEELTTAQEEMQSLNEELQTVNGELEAKLTALASASEDMANLLNSTQIATLFLDGKLRVRSYTPHATALIHLIPSDVGRPVTDLASHLIYPEMMADAREVLRTLVPIEKALITQDGRWFALHVMPYRTMDNRIDGIVITFTDMTGVRKLEKQLRETMGKKKSKA
ncbi:MAG: PAS domain-containing protein [Opitutus sp.]|nr:PAS domain-containing protein [Opitutus sp.]MCS6275180.1 PAS domain-containing protein [Opitutus sp.]MCS6277878.1 PAS domain-containing protein [Opitutus sp.]MCS6299015.1 PAS domain-containing protein [Opitutus sp.]